MAGLHVAEWGGGDRIAVLVHGMTTDSGSWWRVGPALAERGYRVLAVDLPGHGRSPRGPYTLDGFGDALVAAAPDGVELAVGHSLGGLVLARVVDRVRPARAVYVDPAWAPLPGPEAVEYFRGQKSWSVERLAAERLRADGFDVRVVPGTGHVVHNDDVTGFLAALDGWLTAPR